MPGRQLLSETDPDGPLICELQPPQLTPSASPHYTGSSCPLGRLWAVTVSKAFLVFRDLDNLEDDWSEILLDEQPEIITKHFKPAVIRERVKKKTNARETFKMADE